MIICTSTGSFTAVKLFLLCEIKSKNGKNDYMAGGKICVQVAFQTLLTIYLVYCMIYNLIFVKKLFLLSFIYGYLK